MENYKDLYYLLFNRISDLVSSLEQNELTQEETILSLRQLQLDAEDAFIAEQEHHEPTLEECVLQEHLILNSGVMTLLMDSPQYENDPKAAELLEELSKLALEAGKYTTRYIQEHPEGILRWD